MTSRTTPEIRARIAELEARLTRLERDGTEVRAELDSLRREAAAARLRVPAYSTSAESTTPTTSAEKVRLFRSLFRGREDVFPTRFVSKKNG